MILWLLLQLVNIRAILHENYDPWFDFLVEKLIVDFMVLLCRNIQLLLSSCVKQMIRPSNIIDGEHWVFHTLLIPVIKRLIFFQLLDRDRMSPEFSHSRFLLSPVGVDDWAAEGSFDTCCGAERRWMSGTVGCGQRWLGLEHGNRPIFVVLTYLNHHFPSLAILACLRKHDSLFSIGGGYPGWFLLDDKSLINALRFEVWWLEWSIQSCYSLLFAFHVMLIQWTATILKMLIPSRVTPINIWKFLLSCDSRIHRILLHVHHVMLMVVMLIWWVGLRSARLHDTPLLVSLDLALETAAWDGLSRCDLDLLRQVVAPLALIYGSAIVLLLLDARSAALVCHEGGWVFVGEAARVKTRAWFGGRWASCQIHAEAPWHILSGCLGHGCHFLVYNVHHQSVIIILTDHDWVVSCALSGSLGELYRIGRRCCFKGRFICGRGLWQR